MRLIVGGVADRQAVWVRALYVELITAHRRLGGDNRNAAARLNQANRVEENREGWHVRLPRLSADAGGQVR